MQEVGSTIVNFQEVPGGSWSLEEMDIDCASSLRPLPHTKINK
jgi:hypothetical protein